jgi:hypothetical protein
MAKNVKTANFTARDVPETVINRFNDAKGTGDEKKTSAELFEIMVQHFTDPAAAESQKVQDLQKEITRLQDQVKTFGVIDQEIEQLRSERVIMFRDRDNLVDLVSEFGTIDEDHNSIDLVRVIIERYKKLQEKHNQVLQENTTAPKMKEHDFICSLNPVIAHNAAAIRPHLIDDELITSQDPAEYPNELANLAIHNFLLTHYPHLVQ